jgi:hypothetical protein
MGKRQKMRQQSAHSSQASPLVRGARNRHAPHKYTPSSDRLNSTSPWDVTPVRGSALDEVQQLRQEVSVLHTTIQALVEDQASDVVHTQTNPDQGHRDISPGEQPTERPSTYPTSPETRELESIVQEVLNASL